MRVERYRLNPRVMNDLKKRSSIGIIFYLITACIILFTDNYYIRHPESSNQFLFLIAGICMFRLLHLPLSKWAQPKFEKIDNNIFILSVVLTALIWGVEFTEFMIQKGEPNAQLLMVMFSIGLCAGGVIAFIPELRLSIAFSFFMLVPAMIAMAVYHINMPLVIAIGLFFSYLCLMAHRGNREYWDALENEYLLEEKSKDFEKISRIDDLTNLYNRRYFDEAFSFEWTRSVRDKTPISIIVFDIDDFKRINDEYGHLAGDQYLTAIATIIKNIFKRQTDITARYGGDEFIVLISNTALENVSMLAEKVRLKVQALQSEYEGQALQASISAGIATCVPDQKDKPQSLILKADKALYQSKANGRNQVIENC